MHTLIGKRGKFKWLIHVDMLSGQISITMLHKYHSDVDNIIKYCIKSCCWLSRGRRRCWFIFLDSQLKISFGKKAYKFRLKALILVWTLTVKPPVTENPRWWGSNWKKKGRGLWIFSGTTHCSKCPGLSIHLYYMDWKIMCVVRHIKLWDKIGQSYPLSKHGDLSFLFYFSKEG